MKKDNFIVCGVCPVSNCGGYEIQINENADFARYRIVTNAVVRVGYWQKIKYTTTGRAYIADYKTRLYFDEIIHIN